MMEQKAQNRQITEATDSGTENFKVQNMSNSEQQGQREHHWQY